MKETSQSITTGQPDIGGTAKKKRRIFGLITILVGVFFGLVVTEIGLRIVGYSSPDFFIADEKLGYGLIPNMGGTYRKEGKSFVQINSDGFSDVEREIEKPPGVIRIAVIGDSFVEALQVSLADSFVNSTRDRIQHCGVFGDAKIEVLSFGVSGYGTAQELLLLREKVWKYSPDFVILVITTNNDITDNSRVFRKKAMPYFVYRDGALTLDESFRNEKEFILVNSSLARLGTWLKNHLRVVQAISEIQVSLKHKYRAWKDRAPEGETAANVPATTAPMIEVGIDSQIYRPPADPNWENAWRVTEGIIGLMKSEVESHGAKFLVVTGSNGAQVLPNVSERVAFANMLGVDDLLYPDRRIAAFCSSNSIRVIRLAPVLADYAVRERTNLHGFEGNIGYGHWNQLGHRVAGEEIGKRVCEGILR